jgi:hypothetical protein
MNTDYLKELPELEVVIMARNGDKDAAELLWQKYRRPMANVFYGILPSRWEMESEAADVFMHCIINLFNPENEKNRRERWTFFSYLYSSMKGRRSKLLRERVFLSYDESAEFEAESGALNAEKVCLSNKDLFTRYNPEDAFFDLDLKTEVRRLHDTVDRLQKIKSDYSRYIRGMIGGAV